MTIERYLRLIAGFFVVSSLALGYWVSPYWHIFTALVGLNLIQFAFTNRCPMAAILRKLGVRSDEPCEPTPTQPRASRHSLV